MSCTNCYNGCAEITSDQCVKYTGIDVPALGISKGDTLATVEQAIIDFLVPVLTGEGIKPTIAPSVLCDLVKTYLPPCTTCTGFDLNQILKAIIQSVCDLQSQIDRVNETLDTIEADYTVSCLEGVTSSSGTHAILQAVINKLCSLDTTVTSLINTILPLYVLKSELNDLIQVYLDNNQVNNTASGRMIPYAPQPYFGPLSDYPSTGDSFDLSGTGSGYWANVYLCNGNNGTPDLRGRALVGVTTGMGGGSYNPAVDPGISGNPDYTISGSGATQGANNITLTLGQIPNHHHAGTTATDAGHQHNLSPNTGLLAPKVSGSPTVGFDNTTDYLLQSTFITDVGTANISVNVIAEGGGQSHSNIQPSRACYYIMYKP